MQSVLSSDINIIAQHSVKGMIYKYLVCKWESKEMAREL